MTPPSGWVATHLLDGDELATLGPLYHVAPRAIVEANGTTWSTPAINAWVLRTGGITLTNGQPVFARTSIIFLPAGGPRAAVAAPSPSTSSKAAGGLGLLALLAAGAFAIFGGKR